MIALDKLGFCTNPSCRAVLPADRENEWNSGFWVAKRDPDGRVRYFQSRCKDCVRTANRERAARRRREAGCRLRPVSWVAEYEGKLVLFRRCSNPDCGREGPCLDSPASIFPVHQRGNGDGLGWRSVCRDCYNKRQRSRDRRASPQARARKRERYHEQLKDPVFVAAKRAYGRHYYATHRKELLAYQRQLRDIRSVAPNRRNPYDANPERGWVVQSKTGQLLTPAAPFGRWLEAYKLKGSFRDGATLAAHLGIEAHRTTSVLARAQTKVLFDIVGRALTNSIYPGLEVTLGNRQTVEVWEIADLYPPSQGRDYSGDRSPT